MENPITWNDLTSNTHLQYQFIKNGEQIFLHLKRGGSFNKLRCVKKTEKKAYTLLLVRDKKNTK